MTWLFVDDSEEEREAFARALSEGPTIQVDAISGSAARMRLAEAELVADGILMDIDLSNESANIGSGIGLTADIRAAQYKKLLPSFPIVRFSYRARVAESIGNDASSDDLFDIRLDKDGLDVGAVQSALAGIADVYDVLGSGPQTPEVILDVNDDQWSVWGSVEFAEELGVLDRGHLKARLIIQALTLPGMLIEEDLLAARAGICPEFSEGWVRLRRSFEGFVYTGAGAKNFPRWWARGLEAWWDDRCLEAPLAATSIADRHRVLSENFTGLQPAEMPPESLGDRPWRRCELTFEDTGDFVPVDPEKAVRLRPREHLPNWLDPTYAALGRAVQHEEDPRISQMDVSRLKKLARGTKP